MKRPWILFLVTVTLALLALMVIGVLFRLPPPVLSGKITQAELDYLERGPMPVPVVRFVPQGFGPSTANLNRVEFPPLNTFVPLRPRVSSATPGRDIALPSLEDIARAVLGFFLSDARATNCGTGTGTCFWIGGSANWNNVGSWSQTSGGASCACAPASGDAVTFDSNSCGSACTATLVAAVTTGQFTVNNSNVTITTSGNSWGVTVNSPAVLSLTAGTILWNGSTWSAAAGVSVGANGIMNLGSSSGSVGAWTGNSSSMAWAVGTSTVSFTVNGNFYNPSVALGCTQGINEFHNVTIPVGTGNSIGISTCLRLNGTLSVGSGSGLVVANAPTPALWYVGTFSVSSYFDDAGACTMITLTGNLTVTLNNSQASTNGHPGGLTLTKTCSGFSFADSVGGLQSLTGAHTLTVNGNDLANVSISGTTTIHMTTDFATENVTVARPAMIAIDTQNVNLTWTYNGSNPINANGPLYLESDFGGQLCVGQWNFANASQLHMSQVAVCGSIATYPVIVFSGQNLGGNIHWYFGQGGSAGGKAVVCRPSWSYTFFGGIVSCATSMQIPAEDVGWYVNGAFRGTGLSWSGFVFEPSPAQGSLTVTTVYMSTGSGPSLSETSTVQETPNYNLLLYVSGILIVILALLFSNASKDSAGKGPADGLHFSHNYRYTAIRKDRIGNWVGYRQKDPSRFERGSFVTLSVPAAEDHPELRVIRGRLLPSGRWATQSVREYRPLRRRAA